MKIYLAGGMTVTNVKGRERELAYKWGVWRRLFSYYFMDSIEMSQILIIAKQRRSNDHK